jgi:quercetin dioxygenase-like cupin family protein
MQIQTGFIQDVPKVWGHEYWVVNNEKYCMKFLFIEPGGCSSLHEHKMKDETFYVDEGSCFLEVEGQAHRLEASDSKRILPGTKHRFWVPKEQVRGCMIVEVSTQHDDADVVRHEESKRL